MEIQYHLKEKLQIHQLLVIKTIVFFLIISFISCASKAQFEYKNKDVYKIINNELNYLAPPTGAGKIFLEKRLDKLIGELEDLKFHKESYQYHFLTTFYSLPKEEFEYLFNENQINHYKKQFTGEVRLIDSSKLENKKFTIIDLINKTNKLSYYNDKGLVILSYPIFAKNKKYSLIRYYIGDYHRNSGNEGLAIYKKVKSKWVLYKRIGLGMG